MIPVLFNSRCLRRLGLWLLGGCLLVLTTRADVPRLENERLQVTLDVASNALTVVERATQRSWHQVPLGPWSVWPMTRAATAPMLKSDAPWVGCTSIEVPAPGKAPHRFQLAYDDTQLYLRAEVRDAKVVLAAPGKTDYWQSDGIEFWIGAVQLTAVLTHDAQGVELRASGTASSPGPGQVAGKLYQRRAPEQLACRRTPDGYVLTLAIPWGNFPPTLRPGTSAGARSEAADPTLRAAFALAVNDADEPGRRQRQDTFPAGWRYGEFLTYALAKFGATEAAATTPQALNLTQPLTHLEQQGTTLTAQTTRPALLDGRLIAMPCQLAIGLAGNDLRVALTPAPEVEFDELLEPLVFVPALRDPWMVLPASMGLLFPMRLEHPDYFPDIFRNRGEFYSTQGINAACYGCVDPAAGGGLLTIMTTPWLAAFRYAQLEQPGLGRFTQFYTVWYANLGRADGTYRLLHHFSPAGGYVALAKRYRQAVAQAGELVTLKTKAERQPKAARIPGAPVFWLSGRPDELLATARAMRADGITRAIVNLDAYFFDTLGRPDWGREMETVVREISQLGYLVSRYDQYRDTHPVNPNASIYQQWNLEAYQTMAARNKQGDVIGAFGPQARLINPVQALGLERKHFDDYLARYAYDGLFLDTIGYVPPSWDLDWRTDHRTDVHAVVEAKRGLLREAARRGIVPGTEFGNDWVLPWAAWLEGGMTINTFAWGAPGWGYAEPSPYYEKQLDPRYRIPFFALAAGDCATVSWRWEDGMDRYPQYWRKKNLWTVLYGGAPIFFLNRDAYLFNRERIRNTYQNVCEVVQRTVGEEMREHRVLSPDRMVQETVYASGRGVVANFGDHAATLAGGQRIGALDYLTFTAAADGTRTYQAPPVPWVDYDYRVHELTELHEDFEAGYGSKLEVLPPGDKVRFIGVTSQTTARIGGRYSVLGTNDKPRNEWNEFLTTNRYLAPFAPGQRYAVEFDYRIVQLAPNERVYCLARAGFGAGDFLGQTVWFPQTGEQGHRRLMFSVPAGKSATQVFWGFHGVGQVAIDNVEIRKVTTPSVPLEATGPIHDAFAAPTERSSFDAERWQLFEEGLSVMRQTQGGLELRPNAKSNWQSCGLLTRQQRPTNKPVRIGLRLERLAVEQGAIRVGLGLRGGSDARPYYTTGDAAIDCFLMTDGRGAQLMVNSKPAGRSGDNGDINRQGAKMIPITLTWPLQLGLQVEGNRFQVFINGQVVCSGTHTAHFGPWVTGELHVQSHDAGRGAALIGEFGLD
jgi:hypothetical protein